MRPLGLKPYSFYSALRSGWKRCATQRQMQSLKSTIICRASRLNAGLACVIRAADGCNLRCSWCDSEYNVSGPVARWRSKPCWRKFRG